MTKKTPKKKPAGTPGSSRPLRPAEPKASPSGAAGALRMEYLPVDSLKRASSNPKRHSPDIAASVSRFGYADGVILDERTGKLVAGHGRLDELERRKKAGEPPPKGILVDDKGNWKVPVQRGWASKNDAEASAFLLAHNQLGHAGGWDGPELSSLLNDLDKNQVDLTGLGWDADMLKTLMQDPAHVPGGEDPGPGLPPVKPESKSGEIYLLGMGKNQHRLLCGDSQDAEAVGRLFGGEKARLVWTDPPWGVAYQTKMPVDDAAKRHRRKDGKEVLNDGEGEYEAVTLAALANACAHVSPGGTAYAAAAAAAAGPQLAGAMRAFSASGFTLKHSLVWLKDQLVLGRADYHYRHETILYGWKEDGPHYFVDDRTQDSVFEFPRPKRSEEHPTMKPVELVARMVGNSSKPGDLVYDPFLGSSTTMVACHTLGRRCFGVELDLGYCDVGRRRMTELLVSSGLDPGPGALQEGGP